jgi:hypothetical protein
MDDPTAKRLRDLLQITMKLRESIDELLGGLSEQLELLEKATERRSARKWRHKPD